MTNSPAHGNKRAEVSTQAFVRLFIQTGKSTEAVPIKLRLPPLKSVGLLFNRFHAKSGNHSVKVAFFSTCPPETLFKIQVNVRTPQSDFWSNRTWLFLMAGTSRTTAPPNTERYASTHLCCRSCRAISFSLLACSHLLRLRSPFASASIFSCSCL